MMRQFTAFLVALYAIGFAVAALTAVRWPTLLMLGALVGDGAVGELQGLLNWRELGLTYGLIYLIAAFLFYSSSSLIARSGRGSVMCYLFGAGIGFPPFLLFDFESGWWQNPDGFEQCVLFVAVFTLILFSSVLDLSQKAHAKRRAEPKTGANPALVLNKVITPVMATPAPDQTVQAKPAPRPVRRRPVPAAIARQRASFAAYGKRARARQRR